jgi:hypothetical protein
LPTTSCPALNSIQATNIQTDRGIEFERVPTRRCFWIAKEYANLLAYLVDENNACFSFVTMPVNLRIA